MYEAVEVENESNHAYVSKDESGLVGDGESESEFRQYVKSMKRDKKKKKKKKRKRKCAENSAIILENEVESETRSMESGVEIAFEEEMTSKRTYAPMSEVNSVAQTLSDRNDTPQTEREDCTDTLSSTIPISIKTESAFSSSEASQLQQESVQDIKHNQNLVATSNDLTVKSEWEERKPPQHDLDSILYPSKLQNATSSMETQSKRDNTIVQADEEKENGNLEAINDETKSTEKDGHNEQRKETSRKVKRAKREGVQDEEAKWVQCDACEKWRIVPKEFDLDTMPEQWFCHMNTWNVEVASCVVPEEASTTLSERGKAARAAAVSCRKRKAKQVKAKKTNDSHCILDRKQRTHSTLTVKVPCNEDVLSNASGSLGSNGTPNTGKKRKLKMKEKHREVKWVQCENPKCGKWRIVPSYVNISILPVTWYCHLNTWAPELANCDAHNPPEVENIFATKPQSRRSSKKSRNNSESNCSSNGSGKANVLSQTVTLSAKSLKQTRHWKCTTPVAACAFESVSESVSIPKETDTATGTAWSTANGIQVTGHGRGVGAKHGIKKTVLEWAQCEKCNKWRKLPQHIKSSTLPDTWFCSMNHWDPSRASCKVPEEADNEPLEHKNIFSLNGPTRALGTHEQSTHAGTMPSVNMAGNYVSSNHANTTNFRAKRGKLSYTELLFASTGHLRKTYTDESSTSSFEHEGIVYHRDDQYNESSLYAGITKNAKELHQDPRSPESVSDKQEEVANLESTASKIMEIMSLREAKSIRDILYELTQKSEGMPNLSADLSAMLSLLPVIAHALNHLMHTKQVERVDRLETHEKRVQAFECEAIRTANISELCVALSENWTNANDLRETGFVQYYRKTPLLPLKARKPWKECTKLMLST